MRHESFSVRLRKVEPEPLNLMKTLLIRGVVTVFFGFTVACISAQTQSTGSSNATYIQTSKFIGQKVKSSQGDEIGIVKDSVLDRSTGCLAYTVVSTSGGGATRATGGGKMVAVPWAVYSPSSDVNALTVTVDRDRIYNAPVFDYARIEEYSRPEYMTNVYSYYGVSGGAAVGVGSTTTTTGASTTTGTSTTTGASTTVGSAGGAGRAGASPTPAGAQSSATPRGTPAATPRSAASRTRPTASPSARGRETGTPPGRKTRSATGTSDEISSPSARGDTGSRSENERSEQPAERDSGTRESRPESGQSHADQSTSEEKTTGTRHQKKSSKRETSSPPEQPDQQ